MKGDGPKVAPKVEICLEESSEKKKKKRQPSKFVCELCGVSNFNEVVLRLQVNGKKHRHRLKEAVMGSDGTTTAVENSAKSGPPAEVNNQDPEANDIHCFWIRYIS